MRSVLLVPVFPLISCLSSCPVSSRAFSGREDGSAPVFKLYIDISGIKGGAEMKEVIMIAVSYYGIDLLT